MGQAYLEFRFSAINRHPERFLLAFEGGRSQSDRLGRAENGQKAIIPYFTDTPPHAIISTVAGLLVHPEARHRQYLSQVSRKYLRLYVTEFHFR